MQNVAMGWLALALAVSALCGYLLGSINWAIPVCKLLYGTDVRTMGSGNPGMTNVLRNSKDKKGAALTLLGDTGKGALAVFVGRWVVMLLLPGVNVLFGAYVGGIAAILGHMFPLYFGFKGGKGVATSGGVILALQPILALILLAIFLMIVAVSKMVSLGSVIGISLYPVVTLAWGLLGFGSQVLFSTLCAAVIAGLVVWMHRANIRRIIDGTEYKFGQKKKEEQASATEDAPK